MFEYTGKSQFIPGPQAIVASLETVSIATAQPSDGEHPLFTGRSAREERGNLRPSANNPAGWSYYVFHQGLRMLRRRAWGQTTVQVSGTAVVLPPG